MKRGDITREMWNDIEDAIDGAISDMARKYPGHNHYTVERLFLAALLRDINAGKRRLVEFAGGSNGPPRTFQQSRESYRSNRIQIGRELLEAKRRVEAGEYGDVSWWDWYKRNFSRSRSDAEKLMAIAASDE